MAKVQPVDDQQDLSTYSRTQPRTPSFFATPCQICLPSSAGSRNGSVGTGQWARQKKEVGDGGSSDLSSGG
eukprot:CAMPEP_0119325668 /NCGR_PEP_ID=MMETSP1333-20130426/66440_1 /TAXON_ID=418940 /ORGANISM="Scyphosphaera apsteinii, Strain RCC1455" /LENGTH=70 /DNA_ID=CAMNT_0007333725 /DNA_START=273 /DNA_END=485 /DNA_ORIENTATION=-